MRSLTDRRLFERNMQGTERLLLWRAWLGVLLIWPIVTELYTAPDVLYGIKNGLMLTGKPTYAHEKEFVPFSA